MQTELPPILGFLHDTSDGAVEIIVLMNICKALEDHICLCHSL
jgi:hypothetical protein